MNVTIYHNPRCSKSRATLALLTERGLQPEIIEYLKTPPPPQTVRKLLTLLGLTADQLMRKGEDEYKAAQSELAQMDDDDRIKWLCAHPRVIERPIVVSDNGARIGRPPENVLDIL